MDEEFRKIWKIWKSLNNIVQDVQVFLWDRYVDAYPEIRLATVPEVALWLAVTRQVFLPVAPPEKVLLYDYGEGPDIYLTPGIDISTVPEGKHTCLIIEPQGPATAPLNIVEYDAGTAPAALFLQRRAGVTEVTGLGDLIAQTNMPFVPVWPDVEQYLQDAEEDDLMQVVKSLFT